MIGLMSLEEVQSVVGGDITGGNAVFTSVSIDTRTLQEDELFVAITGPNFNANEFLEIAAEKQACGAILSEMKEGILPTLKVSDTRKALGEMGAMNRERSTACVIALTGSQGKTTVKEMTGGILAGCGEVLMTQGNLNNDLGVPLSLLRLEAHHDFAVIELGANGPGEIAYTTGLTRPHIGHITNITETHLEGFGDLTSVSRAKGEIWQGIEAGGIAVVNLDDEFANRFIEEIKSQTQHMELVTISTENHSAADFYTDEIRLQQFHSVIFNLHTPAGLAEIKLRVAGRHNVSNALAAAALAMSAGVDLDDVKAGLESFSSVQGRMFIVPGLNQSTVIDDSYNASPASFRAAIDVMANTTGTRIVVMGDMGELGSDAEKFHREIGEYAKEQGIEYFFAVGELSKVAAEQFGNGGSFLEDRELFSGTIRSLLNESTTILIKGSRSQQMEKLVKQIQAESECA